MSGVIGQLLNKIGPFFLIIWGYLELAPVEFGKLVFVYTIIGLSVGVVLFGTGVSGIRLQGLYKERKQVLKSIFLLRLSIYAVLSVVFSLINIIFNIFSIQVLILTLLIIHIAVHDAEFIVLYDQKYQLYWQTSLFGIAIYVFGIIVEVSSVPEFLLTVLVAQASSQLFLAFRCGYLHPGLWQKSVQASDPKLAEVLNQSAFLFASTYQTQLLTRTPSIYLGIVEQYRILALVGILEKMVEIVRIFVQALHKYYAGINIKLISHENVAAYCINQKRLFVIGFLFLLVASAVGSFCVYIGYSYFDSSGQQVKALFIFCALMLAALLNHISSLFGINWFMLYGLNKKIFVTNFWGLVFSYVFVIYVYTMGSSLLVVLQPVVGELAVVIHRVIFFIRGRKNASVNN